ncbi:uncharacterized protein LOC119165692 [Rhipicephalus microplus]|uniref:uncharacterized protein LOC142769233 n=1 Tax=Rhipicephalus microplus TaxID=6941 RepID=UPI003F6CF172
MQPATVVLLLSKVLLIFCQAQFYPELRSDLQQFQDSSRCFPDIGEWYQIYRNYYYDPNYGGTAKCVKYTRYGAYQNFSTPSMFTYGQESGDIVEQTYQIIYVDCNICYIVRHPYADNGYGCTLWRRLSTFQQPADCCDFIYAENCGTTPRYQIYEPSCSPGLGLPAS